MLQRSNRFQRRAAFSTRDINLGAEFQNPPSLSLRRPLAFVGAKIYMPLVGFS
jgi:hypothetical protein